MDLTVYFVIHSQFLDKLEDCNSEEIKNIPDKINCDLAIFKKNFPFKILKKFSKENKNLLIGIINPSDKNDGLKCIKLADFAIVGSVEKKPIIQSTLNVLYILSLKK